MSQITTEARTKVVRQHIQEGHTLYSLAAEYGGQPFPIGYVHTVRMPKQ